MLLATIPAALPATFTLSAAFGAQTLARRGVLLTRLSAVHEAAAMDVLCADKTGTLTRNELKVVEVVALAGFDRARVLALAALASSEADQDPIDAAVRAAAKAAPYNTTERLVRFVPFDPATKSSEAFVVDQDGTERRIIKGAFEVIAKVAELPDEARALVKSSAEQGHRVIAVAFGPSNALRLVGLIAISDPPREDLAKLIGKLREMGVRTVMVTGDSAGHRRSDRPKGRYRWRRLSGGTLVRRAEHRRLRHIRARGARAEIQIGAGLAETRPRRRHVRRWRE